MANYSDIRYEVTGTDVYSDITDLPLSGVDTGTQAFVSGSNRLYMWTGTGWYNIALINTNPSLSGASSAYDLSTEGANTVVTLASTDPEGIPISFTVSHSGLGVGANAIATVTQSNNIFTFTPTTNTALAGTFTTTFTASDGVNVAVANSSFTLAFSVNNSKYTTALITSVGGNNADNNDFVDSSTNSHTITASGNATQGTFSPYRHGGNSVLFPGGDQGDGYLDMGAAIVPATGSWTFQSWIRVTQHSDATDRHTLLSWYQNSQSGRGDIQVRGRTDTDPGVVFVYADGMSAYLYSTTRVDDGAWHHVAVERNGNVWSVWVDGTREDQGTQSVTLYTGSNTRIGQGINTAGYNYRNMNGEMRDVRFSESARYSGAATIDVPTEDETNTTGYSLLCCQSFDPFVDKTDTYTISVVATNVPVKQVGASPYDYKTYTSSDHGGSMYLDGTGDYLTIAHDTTLKPGTSGAFSIEFWYYPTATPSGNPAQITGDLGVTSYPSNCHGFDITHDTSGNLNVRWGSPAYQDGSSGDGGAITNNALALNQWHHIVLCRDAESTPTMALFRNGKRCWYEAGSQVAITDATASNFYVGYAGSTSGTTFTPVTGLISDFKFRKGATSFDPTSSTLTVSSTPSSSDTETSLLISGTNAGIIDKSQTAQTLTLYGDAKSSTTQTKYLSSSVYLDGTGDYLDIVTDEGFNFSTSNFTIEFWMYPSAIGSENIILESRADHTDSGFLIMLNGSVIKNLTSGSVRTTGGTTITTGSWYHVAVVRDSTSLRTYLNGTEESGSASYTASITNPFSKFRLGARFDGASPFNGYFSDVRITKGLARYTSNFTPPTAALQG